MFAVQYAALASDDGVIVESRVLADADLTADQAIRSDTRTTGDTGLRCNYCVFADLDVMRNLDQVVELHAVANDRSLERAAVDARIRSDFDIVFHDDSPDLRELYVGGPVFHEPESIGANHSPCMNDHAVSDRDIFVDDNTWIQRAVLADTGLLDRKSTRLNSSHLGISY